jgi:nucleotide-binding universal stress UspA family protein
MPHRVLVGYDHSEEAAAGLRRAAALAAADRAELTIVHVAMPPPAWASVGVLPLVLADDVVSLGEALVRHAVEELPQDLAVRWRLVVGPEARGGLGRHRCVGRVLWRVLEDEGHDVIVVGTGMRPGRVTRALLRRCPDRVVTVPFSPQPEAGWSAPKMLPSVSLK